MNNSARTWAQNFAILALLPGVGLHAQVTPLPVTSTGIGPLTFDTQPGLSNGWSTLAVGALSGTYTTASGLDSSVTNQNASAIANALASSQVLPPGVNAV